MNAKINFSELFERVSQQLENNWYVEKSDIMILLMMAMSYHTSGHKSDLQYDSD
jgi:hypothetical protein